jgi:hypothetical protein
MPNTKTCVACGNPAYPGSDFCRTCIAVLGDVMSYESVQHIIREKDKLIEEAQLEVERLRAAIGRIAGWGFLFECGPLPESNQYVCFICRQMGNAGKIQHADNCPFSYRDK